MDGVTVQIRRAEATDVPAIVEMIANDQLGAKRERPGDPRYLAAFEEIAADPNQYLAVMEVDGSVAGTLQLTFTPGLSRLGMRRATIEAVRVHENHRGSGLGQRFIEWAIEEARSRGCGLVQLTTDASRADAHRFYERLGFKASHIGMKLPL
ncbi:GNAT family N-acetyltransferase [Kibdelosporangium persicum]|uniref:Aminoalkylphosphonic acid N-acetyltransferase n=1 Tax=Kibdelosporangium persicum TaxID=2698649 RepID=A0ABX2FD19_9PSEU|nr:GNAT family N-acetyltransferase [Kibdelosporangium persicum]NRN69266.1 Aminoalkylphosphonic acid N-acetyltransferase [Kibdelosporangium persicum]